MTAIGAVAAVIELDSGQVTTLWRHVGQRPEEMTFRIGKTRQRPLMSGAVDTVACCAHDPLHQLAVAIGCYPEIPQGAEVVLDGFAPGLDEALLLGVLCGTRGDEEAEVLE